MMPRSTHSALRDRRTDSPRTSGGEKPPILGRACQRFLAILAMALICYGTLGPLGGADGKWLERAAQWQWTPASQPCDFNDTVTNIFVYIPIGWALRLLLRRRGRAGLRDFLAAATLAAALSYLTELLQQFMPARSSNLNDVGLNLFGALIGCFIAPHSQRITRVIHSLAFIKIRTRPWSLAACAAAVGAAALMTAPWNLTSPMFELTAAGPLVLTDLARFGLFALVGFVFAAAAVERCRSIDRSVLIAIVGAVILAASLETAQAFIGARLASLQHFLIACLGGLLGVAAGSVRHRLRIAPIPAAIALLATVGYLLVAEVAGTQHALTPGLSAIEWRLPFQALFMKPFDHVIADVLESFLLYAFLSVLSLILARRARAVSALVLLVGLVGTVECFRMTFAGGVFDMTPFVVAAAAWAATCYAWTALRKSAQTAG